MRRGKTRTLGIAVQTTSIKAVLFDFDGVLTVDKTGSLTTTRYLSERTGIELSKVQSVFRRFNNDLTIGKTTHEQIWEQICHGLGKTLSIGLLKEAFESTPLNERMLELAKELRSRYAVGIITDNKKDRIDHLRTMHKLDSLFDPIAVSAEFGAGKENPEIFSEVLRRLSITPQECIFVDNSRKNLIAPGSLGIKTIYFDEASQDFNALLTALKTHGAVVSDA
jgi:HAD superfamily hydrolase (TIGR01509 family)